jgi:lysophospholipase L1-like esterase
VKTAWDWVGVVGTGQSLAVGQFGIPARATTQPYSNLKLQTGSAAWPLDPNDPTLSLVPLVEPIGRPSTGYPSSYPTNIAGETPHAAMANQVTALFKAAGGADYVTVHGEFGENGQCLRYLKKNATPSGVNGRAYAATLLETRAVKRLAEAAGKTYGVGAIIVTHGECDAGNERYAAELYQLYSDYAADLAAITGQTQKPLMIVSQQSAVNDRAASTLAQWQIGALHPADVVCSGPKYQYEYARDGVHLVTRGYQALGEKYGQIYFERVVLGHAWRPLEPTSVERSGPRAITIHFHVPVAPLVWDSALPPPHADTAVWRNGKGFELWGPSGKLAIASVALAGDAVTVSAANDLPASELVVGYALTGGPDAMQSPHQGTFRWGLLRDSDPFIGLTTGVGQPNYAVAFELPVP